MTKRHVWKHQTPGTCASPEMTCLGRGKRSKLGSVVPLDIGTKSTEGDDKHGCLSPPSAGPWVSAVFPIWNQHACDCTFWAPTLCDAFPAQRVSRAACVSMYTRATWAGTYVHGISILSHVEYEHWCLVGRHVLLSTINRSSFFFSKTGRKHNGEVRKGN